MVTISMSMYNKIFTKILDSSVWLESTPTRIVWLTFIAAMDEIGYCQFASVGNLAARARVTLDEAKEAVKVLEAPDEESADPDNEGRRIERVQGGWIVLNASKYRALVTRANIQEKVRERVRRFRERKRTGNAHVTHSNGTVTQGNDPVTQSEADSNTSTEKPSRGKRERPKKDPSKTALVDARHKEFKEAVKAYWDSKNKGVEIPWGPAEGKQLGMFLRDAPHITIEQFKVMLRNRYKSNVNHGDRPSQWLFCIASYGPAPVDRFNKPIEEGTNGQGGPSATKQRVDGARRVLAEIAVERGLIDPAELNGRVDAPVSESRPGVEHQGILQGLRTVGPEILPPKG
jgi:hypothetical protein